MDIFNFLIAGFEVALATTKSSNCLYWCIYWYVVGLLPGLGPINGVAILLPFAYALGLPVESALILLAAVYLGCEYGGTYFSHFINVPGDAGAIMTTLDGYPLAQQGKAGIALSLSSVSSFIGSTIAFIGIVLFAPILAKWAIAFGPAEYFALMVFAIVCLTGLVSTQPFKTLIMALIGFGLSTVGMDAITGVYRFTFDSVGLSDGIAFTTIVIGLIQCQ